MPAALIKSGRKQLFGTQAQRDPLNQCWCLADVEPSFPDDRRVEFTRRKLGDQVAWILTLNDGRVCAPFCRATLKPTPAGTVPGFW